MLELLMVPLDGSALAEHAVRAALAIAERSHAALVLVRAWSAVGPRETPASPVWAATDPARGEAATRYLDDVVARIGATHAVSARPIALAGHPSHVICEQAAAFGVDLIVMTAHGQTGSSHTWLGNTANAVIQRATVPVLLHKPRNTGPNGESHSLYQRVLVSLDGSPGTDRIISFARELGDLAGASYAVMHVIPIDGARVVDAAPGPEIGASASGVEDDVRRAVARMQASARRLGLGEPGRSVRSCLVMADRPEAAILREATNMRADLVAMAISARRGERGDGDVARYVSRGGEHDLLVCRALSD